MATETVQNCANKDLVSLWTLLASCIGNDGTGALHLRVEEITGGTSDNAITCANNGLTEWEQLELLIRQCIVIRADGKTSLRIQHP